MQRYSSAARRLYTERPGNTRRPNPLRLATPREEPTTDPLARDAKLARLEATLFLADEPLTAKKLAEVAGLQDITEVKQQLAKLRGFYDADESSFQIEELAGGYQLLTRPTFHTWLLRLRRTGHDLRLTPAALETLAVVAYKQPITRADLDSIRGVSCAELIRQLMEKGLVRLAGRQASLGRPQLYGTTKKFLQVFGLKSLEDLPEVDSLPKPR
jgi:segregation and condensation protein B